MTAVQMPERPVFNSLDPTLDEEMLPPISRWAVTCFVLGFLSLIAGLTIVALPFAVLVAICCLVVTWRLSSDKSVGGLRLAQFGLFLSVLSSCWSAGSNYMRESFFYSQGAAHAKLFLDQLSAGKTFAAFELTLPEVDRQITGTDLEAHYTEILAANLPSPSSPPMSNGESPSPELMKNGTIKEKLSAFLSTESTLEAISHGADANWQLLKGSEARTASNNLMNVSVVMVDKAKPEKKIVVTMKRQLGAMTSAEGEPPIALWEIDKAEVVKE